MAGNGDFLQGGTDPEGITAYVGKGLGKGYVLQLIAKNKYVISNLPHALGNDNALQASAAIKREVIDHLNGARNAHRFQAPEGLEGLLTDVGGARLNDQILYRLGHGGKGPV